MDEKLKKQIETLIKTSIVSCLSSVDESGFPTTKAMMNIQRDGLFTHYFSTFLYAARTTHYQNNPKASIYMYTVDDPKGLMLIGDMQVLTDTHHKQMLWREGFEKFYPDGVETKNYCVLKFTAQRGDFCYGDNNVTFSVQDF